MEYLFRPKHVPVAGYPCCDNWNKLLLPSGCILMFNQLIAKKKKKKKKNRMFLKSWISKE